MENRERKELCIRKIDEIAEQVEEIIGSGETAQEREKLIDEILDSYDDFGDYLKAASLFLWSDSACERWGETVREAEKLIGKYFASNDTYVHVTNIDGYSLYGKGFTLRDSFAEFWEKEFYQLAIKDGDWRVVNTAADFLTEYREISEAEFRKALCATFDRSDFRAL